MPTLRIFDFLTTDRRLLAQVEAIPNCCWQFRLIADADYPDHLSFVVKIDGGQEVLVGRYLVLTTSVYGAESASDDYRIYVNGLPQTGRETTARRAYESLVARLGEFIAPYVREERRKLRERQAAEEAAEAGMPTKGR